MICVPGGRGIVLGYIDDGCGYTDDMSNGFDEVDRFIANTISMSYRTKYSHFPIYSSVHL